MPVKDESQLGVNSWLQDELREQFQHDRSSVDESWKHLFEGGNGVSRSMPAVVTNGTAIHKSSNGAEALAAGPGEELVPLRGAAARIAENMAASLSVPLATSQRTIPVKVIDENRRLINHHRTLLGSE